MFETVTPARQSRTGRNALYEALSFSIAVHGLAAGLALASNLWEVTFPNTSPMYTVAFALMQPPPPPPAPPKPLQAKQEPVKNTALIAQAAVLAPTIIPEEIPVVKKDAFSNAFAVPNGTPGGIPVGMDGGVIGGIAQGEAGGKVGGTIGGVVQDLPADGRVHFARDRKLPMLPLSQVYPNYPEDARVRSWEDELVVRYIIGKDGRVKDVRIIRAPQRDVFVRGTMNAIRSWRFRPFIKDGEKQEVVHELTVFYRLNAPT
ncbi:MAG: energy transducer TonB [Thermoanaerobaculia bacterium]